MYDQPQQGGHSFEMGRTESNPMGVVGFILSLSVCLSPIGLIVSLIALTKRPKGFAVAGVIIGLLASVLLGALVVGGRALWPHIQSVLEVTSDYKEISTRIESYKAANNGALPADLAAAGVTGDALVDPWGQEYRLRVLPDGSDWFMDSAGIDAQWGTKDDFSFRSGMTDREMSDEIQKIFESHFDPNFKRSGPAIPSPASSTSEAPADEKPAEEPAPSGSTP